MTPDEMRAVFGRRARKARLERRWSVREMADRSGGALSPSTITRAERGREIWLGMALAIAGALELTLAQMLAEPECARCDGNPPAGFSCPDCDRTGAT
jgi:transcriptional regulator with XRE-family HTH domain